jgi:hypothetical protein
MGRFRTQRTKLYTGRRGEEGEVEEEGEAEGEEGGGRRERVQLRFERSRRRT